MRDVASLPFQDAPHRSTMTYPSGGAGTVSAKGAIAGAVLPFGSVFCASFVCGASSA